MIQPIRIEMHEIVDDMRWRRIRSYRVFASLRTYCTNAEFLTHSHTINTQTRKLLKKSFENEVKITESQSHSDALQLLLIS